MSLDSKNIGEQAVNSAPVSIAQASAMQDPEFVDAEGLRNIYGIKRSLAYALLADGSIRGVSLRRRGQLRGKRLFSVRSYLNSQMENQKPASS